VARHDECDVFVGSRRAWSPVLTRGSYIAVGPSIQSNKNVGFQIPASGFPAENRVSSTWRASCWSLEHSEDGMNLPDVVQRVRSEFLEMPGLQLTPGQARRLWNLEGELCQAVIDALVAEAFLRWTASGAVRRIDA
jgi:hypothetical protein